VCHGGLCAVPLCFLHDHSILKGVYLSVVDALGVSVRDLGRPTAMETWKFNVSQGGRFERKINTTGAK
jgi:hypothetical protein